MDAYNTNSDTTHVLRPIGRRKARLGDGDGLDFYLETPKPKKASEVFKPSKFGNLLRIFEDVDSQNVGESEFKTPEQKLLNSIEIVKKEVMEELDRLKRTPSAML